MEFWWLALIIWIVAIALVIAAFSLRNKRKLSMQILFCLSLFLLLFKTVEFSTYRIINRPSYPVEFSHISYFVLGAAMVSGIKKMRSFAGLCSLASGFGFLVAATAAPSSIYNDTSSIYSMIVSISQHLILLFAGVLLVFSFDKYSIKDIWISFVGVASILIFSWLVHKRIIYKDFSKWDDMVIVYMMTGTILKYVLPSGFVIPLWLRIGTIVVLLAAMVGAIVLYTLINNKIFDKREKNGNALQDADYELGIKAVVLYFINKKKNAQPPKQEPTDLQSQEVEKDIHTETTDL